jgi:hypothetical protein
MRGIFAGTTAVAGALHKAGELPRPANIAMAANFEALNRVFSFTGHRFRIYIV